MSQPSQAKNKDINDLLDKIERGEFTIDGEIVVMQPKMSMFEQMFREAHREARARRSWQDKAREKEQPR
jgi:ATP-dependent DNA ligase